ncbi:amidohydrolase family protein, partial [Actinocorallia lasiicapitis]
MSTYTNARLVTPAGVLDGGWLTTENGTITGLGQGPREGRDLGGAYLVPGFVDIHVHGGGGHSAMTSKEAIRSAAAFHRGRGTTTLLASLVTADLGLLAEAAGWIADLTEEGVVAGGHFEGPFLSHARCGAQDPAALRLPDLAELRLRLDAGRG